MFFPSFLLSVHESPVFMHRRFVFLGSVSMLLVTIMGARWSVVYLSGVIREVMWFLIQKRDGSELILALKGICWQGGGILELA